MTQLEPRVTRVVWLYGLLGLAPFFVAAYADVAHLAQPGWWRGVLSIYAAIILSFLGGARWGMELLQPPVRTSVITASMVPSVIGFLLLLAPPGDRAWALCGLAVAHGFQWVWDVSSTSTPAGYGTLRSFLTACVIVLIGVDLMFA